MAPEQPTEKAMRRVGERIRAARLDRQISLRSFAAEMDLSPSYFSKVERGEALAGTTTYERICARLELDPKELLQDLGLIDSETQRLFEEQYRANAREVEGLLRKMAERKRKR